MVDVYLVISGDQSLSGRDRGATVHSKITIFLILYKGLKDVQHLQNVQKHKHRKLFKSSSGNPMHCLGEALTYSSALAEEKDPMPLLFPEFQQRLHDNHLA